MALISVNRLLGFLFTWFNYNNFKCDYSHPGLMLVITTLISANLAQTHCFHKWQGMLRNTFIIIKLKIPPQTSYCSQTLASLYDLHKSPPDSECRGSFDNTANYSLEDVLLLSKIASHLISWNFQNQNRKNRNLLEVTLQLRVMMSFSDNYSHYEQMSLAGHLLSIVTLYVTPCDTCIWCNTFVTISVTMTTGHNRSNMEWW